VATKDWVLLVDSDERVTPELRAEIREDLALHGSRYAVLLVIVMVEWNRDVPDGLPAEPTAATAPEIIEFFGVLPLKARTADLTGPLEDELLHLQSDLEKARLSVERDLRSAL
jgi:hypothetical protein